MRKTIKDDIQTNVNKNNCNEETVTNFDNNNVLQVNVNSNKITSRDTREHQIRITIKKKYHRAKNVQMHRRMKKKHLKRTPRKIKTHRHIVKGHT